METDGRYMMDNNFRYSRAVLDACLAQGTQFLYASSAATYGGSTRFVEEREVEAPLNIYGYSKFLFDQVIRRVLPTAKSQIAGFRYFNVYGPRETHKGRMASVAFHNFNQFRAEGKVKLFGEYNGYAPGEQTRDFVSVEDVTKVNLFFFDHPEKSGIFNLGTGRAQPFNDIASTVVNTLRALDNQPPLTLAQQVEQGLIEYVPFPDALRGKYQCFTQADQTKLRAAGYDAPFLTVQEGVDRYVRWLSGRFKRKRCIDRLGLTVGSRRPFFIGDPAHDQEMVGRSGNARHDRVGRRPLTSTPRTRMHSSASRASARHGRRRFSTNAAHAVRSRMRKISRRA